MRRLGLLALALAIVGTGCGGGDGDTGGDSTRSDIEAANEAAIQAAEESPEALAERGAPAVRRILLRELQMEPDETFRLNPEEPTDCERELEEEGRADTVECIGDESDCYVKTGAEAAAFAETDPANILRSPNGRDLVFVQTYVGVPLSDCLTAVRRALKW